ncbi:MAG: ankyrin repeat domain-containing protein, partial [Culicoidibacterales bacterium]
MIMLDSFDAASEGDYKKFILFYKKNVNEVDKYSKLSLLQTAVCRDKNPKDRLKIIKFLLRKKVDINYVSTDEKRNALHYLFF